MLMLTSWISIQTLSGQAVYEVWFTAGAVKHHGLILASDVPDGWKMRIKYFDRTRQCSRLIEQKIRVEETSLGYCLLGHSVWDVQEQRRTSDYAADRLYVYRDDRGMLYSRNVDGQGLNSKVVIKTLGREEAQKRQLEFGW